MVTVHGITFPEPRPAKIAEVEGDAASVNAFADSLHGVCADFEELADFAWTAGQPLWNWVGDDAEAYTSSATMIQADANVLHLGMKRVARGATMHAQTLTELDSTRLDLVERLSATNQWRTELIAQLQAIEEPLLPLTRFSFLVAVGSLSSSYDELVADHVTFKQTIKDNDRTMRELFEKNQTLAGIKSENDKTNQIANEAIARRPGLGLFSTPEANRRWWESLSEAEQQAVLLTRPELIGGMDGLPADLRDEANRVVLNEQLAALAEKERDGTITDHEREVLDNSTHIDNAIKQAEKYVDPITGEHPPIQLWQFDPEKFGTDNGSVAISVGDLDTADDIAMRVPGITNEVDDIETLTSEATNLYEAVRFNGDDDRSVASMIWLGYNTPDAFYDPATLGEGRAEEGGAILAGDVDGLRASRDDRAHLTVIGHSYGSTTSAHAASDHNLDADDLALVGSPGAGNGHVSDLNIDKDHVWAGRNTRDVITTLGDHGTINPGNIGGGLGRDPAEDDFGGQRFTAEDQGRSSWHRGVEAHGNYFNQDTESLYNLSRIVDGDYDAVVHADHVHDPWWGGPQDPEEDRDDIKAPDTGEVEYK